MPALRQIYVCGHLTGGHNETTCPRQSHQQLSQRVPSAGPQAKDEVERYLGFYSLARQQGDSFDEGIATALEAILVAPDFLFRIEKRSHRLEPPRPSAL